jgi:cardiolipin synthase C
MLLAAADAPPDSSSAASRCAAAAVDDLLHSGECPRVAARVPVAGRSCPGTGRTDSAGSTLDVQTFIWHADLTGRLLSHLLLAAADRGVRVRVLVDDVDARRNYAPFAALAAHRNIAVRIFNPLVLRRGLLGLINAGREFQRIDRRMHNKTWIVDNRLAAVGGRNLGDEYFDASGAMNFVDLDFAMFGPIVRDASTSFDRYWNSPAAYPMDALDPAGVNIRALAALRNELGEATAGARGSAYAGALRADDAVRQLVTGDRPMQWSARHRFAADDPLKTTLRDRDLRHAEVRRALLQAVQGARADVLLISPYFVPGDSTVAWLGGA